MAYKLEKKIDGKTYKAYTKAIHTKSRAKKLAGDVKRWRQYKYSRIVPYGSGYMVFVRQKLK